MSTSINDELIWKYIDGHCNAAECHFVEELLILDSDVREKLKTSRRLHKSLQTLTLKKAPVKLIQHTISQLDIKRGYQISFKPLLIFLLFLAFLLVVSLLVPYNTEWYDPRLLYIFEWVDVPSFSKMATNLNSFVLVIFVLPLFFFMDKLIMQRSMIRYSGLSR